MNISREIYPRYADARAPHSTLAGDCVRAFLCGGAICAFAEGLKKIYLAVGLIEDDAALLTSVSLVFIAVALTGIGVFDKIAKFAGAGTLVPITGFANSVASPAMDSYPEGVVLGVGAKIFIVAGPVLLYGTLAGAAVGVIYWLSRLLF